MGDRDPAHDLHEHIRRAEERAWDAGVAAALARLRSSEVGYLLGRAACRQITTDEAKVRLLVLVRQIVNPYAAEAGKEKG